MLTGMLAEMRPGFGGELKQEVPKQHPPHNSRQEKRRFPLGPEQVNLQLAMLCILGAMQE